MLKGTSHPPDKVVGRMRADGVPRILGIHRREGRGQRRDGRRQAGISAGDPGAWRRAASPRARQQHHVDGRDRRGERPDPQRDRHECRHRRAGSLQPRQCHHRPRLQPRCRRTCRAARCRATPTWARSATGTTTARRFAEAEERSPWQPFHVQKGFKPAESTVSVFFGGRYTHAGFGPRETWKEKMRRCLRRPSTTCRRCS